MPKWCTVPNCRTGSRTEKKCSMFRVPKDATTLKKWEEAIPGIVKLKRTDIVCEKHFDTIDIAREWIMLTASGQVIARVPYKYPQLKKHAVPTIFNDVPTGKKNKSLHNYAKRNVSQNIKKHCNAPVESSELGVACVSPTTPRTNIDIVIDSVIEVSSYEPPLADSLSSEENSHLDHGYAKRYLDSEENPPNIKDTACVPIPSPGTSTCTDTSFSATKVLTCECSVAGSSPFQKSAEAPTSLEIDKPEEPDGKAITEADLSASVPESWSYGVMRSELVHRTLFSYTITKIENGVSCPVTQKSVTLDVDGTLQYFVYGRHIDLQDTKLERVLRTKELLPDVLNKFRGMNVCSGLGDVNVYLVSGNSAYQDYVDNWRSKGCSLLSTKRRCASCIKLRKCILQSALRLNTRTSVSRVSGVSNPVIQRKLSALRAQIKRERRQKLRAKDCMCKCQTTSLKTQEAEMADKLDVATISVSMTK